MIDKSTIWVLMTFFGLCVVCKYLESHHTTEQRLLAFADIRTINYKNTESYPEETEGMIGSGLAPSLLLQEHPLTEETSKQRAPPHQLRETNVRSQSHQLKSASDMQYPNNQLRQHDPSPSFQEQEEPYMLTSDQMNQHTTYQSLQQQQQQSQLQQQQLQAPTTHGETYVNNSEEPSYLQLCRELLLRRGAAESDKSFEQTSMQLDPFIVRESREVCSSQRSYHALAHMMLSASIAQAGSMLRLHYLHDCGNTDDESDIYRNPDLMDSTPTYDAASIQQMLPPFLSFSTGIGEQPMAQKCEKCMALLPNRDMVDCMGFPGPNAPTNQGADVPKEHVDPMTLSLRVAGFRHNIQQAIQQMHKTELSITENVSPPNHGDVVIVLDLESETFGQAWVLPFFYYQDIIPVNVASVSVLVTQRCIDIYATCHDHSRLLVQELTKLYPNASIQEVIVTSTAMGYARIADVPILICPPTFFCLFASLFREYSQATYTVTRNVLFEWFKYVARENRKLMGKKLVVEDESQVMRTPLGELSSLIKFLKLKRPIEG